MTKNIQTRAVAFAAAALMTMTIFTGTGMVAGNQARLVAANATIDRACTTQVAMEVQHVTIVGHRHHA